MNYLSIVVILRFCVEGVYFLTCLYKHKLVGITPRTSQTYMDITPHQPISGREGGWRLIVLTLLRVLLLSCLSLCFFIIGRLNGAVRDDERRGGRIGKRSLQSQRNREER